MGSYHFNAKPNHKQLSLQTPLLTCKHTNIQTPKKAKAQLTHNGFFFPSLSFKLQGFFLGVGMCSFRLLAEHAVRQIGDPPAEPVCRVVC